MKKLMTILVVFAMCGAVMAQGVTGTSSAEVQIPLTNGKNKEYINFQTETEQGRSGLTYSVWGSKSNGYDPNRLGHVYFTVEQAALDQYNAANNTNASKVTVQFVGTYTESYTTEGWGYLNNGARVPYETVHTLEVSDYGIYLYDPKTGAKGTFVSMSSLENNSIEIDPGKSFGVYYTGTQVDTTTYEYRGEEYTLDPTRTSVTANSTDGYIGNFDKGNGTGDKVGQNKITVYKENEDGVIVSDEDWTFKKYMCLFGTNDPINNRHWEFMLQTRVDDPKVDVRPEDVNEEIPTASGQPLPGTLATLLIGGLCAKALRKKNQK
jgi:Ni/Co efflux regulator RcnB